MELVFFNPEQFVKAKKVARPTLTITKGSMIKLNPPLVELLKAKAGQKLCIGQDKKDKTDWYICIGEGGFNLKATVGPADQTLLIQCKPLADTLRESFSKHAPPIRIPVTTEPTDAGSIKLFGLLTRAIGQ